jgi:hypothetical protein
VTADPGETKTVKIIVTNPSNAEVSVKPIQNDFVADDKEDGSPAIILDENEYSKSNSLKRFLAPLVQPRLFCIPQFLIAKKTPLETNREAKRCCKIRQQKGRRPA